MSFTISVAKEADAPALAALRTAVAQDLTRRYGVGHWSACKTEQGALRDINVPGHLSRMLVAKVDSEIVGTLRLATKKPWAIDPAHFTPVQRALYLVGMAVAPDRQGQGIGRRLIREAVAVAKVWPAQSIRLDAYDTAAGAGLFYAKCGFSEVGRVIYRKVPLIYFENVF